MGYRWKALEKLLSEMLSPEATGDLGLSNTPKRLPRELYTGSIAPLFHCFPSVTPLLGYRVNPAVLNAFYKEAL